MQILICTSLFFLEFVCPINPIYNSLNTLLFSTLFPSSTGFWFEFVVDSNAICKSKENANCLMNYISFLFFFHNLILYNVLFSGLISGHIYSSLLKFAYALYKKGIIYSLLFLHCLFKTMGSPNGYSIL